MTMFQYYKRSRHFVFSAFIAFVFVLLCQNTAFARASSNGDLPTKADLQAQLDSLNKQKDLSAQDKLVQQDLTDTLATLDKIDRIKEETVQLRQKVAEAPEKMRQATAALTALSDVDNDEETRKILSTLSLRQLETRVAQALDDLQNAQNDLASYNSQLVSLQTQPERVQNAMCNASQQLQQIRSRLDGTDVGETALRPSQKVLMQAQQALLNAEIDQQRKSLEGNTVLQDTLQKQRDYVTANSARLEHQLQLLQEAVNSKRLTLTEKTAQEAVSPDEAARIQANPLVKQELEINQQLSQRLITATENGNQLMQQNIKVKNWLERALQSERNIKEQIAVLKGSLLLSRILYQQQQTLPSADELENMTNRIADLRLEQFEVNQQRDALFQSDAFVNKLEEGHTNEVNSEVHDALLQVVDMRRELLDQLNKQLGNQQTLRITMLLMFALFGVMFWAIWSDLITVFSYLDSITLWHYNGTEAGAAVVKNVTMGSLLFAIIASMVAWALIRNLPGLLEVLVLSRLNMRQGASYAITTILNYIIIAVGAMTVFGSLGVSWDKLQWLAAALSVGLGFGLQEIFGNFVSGLIILFERPVRIGDTVTIGSFSGTVSKIRIRATTITDFDRKEVIIPNKAFVTERLINWSLTDTTTRLVIRLGVAYGSDLEKVRKVLLKAATEHPRVMHEPMPEVFFTAFGASTLDHELRLYVRELRDRSRTVDELNRTIDQLCRENDINIAFNQLEVHLHNEKGDEVTEVKRDYKGDDPTPAVG
ncbi:mechanosensitive ion channel [Escherichia coli]|nr:mechanosensitive ion channel [Escherichia coli]